MKLDPSPQLPQDLPTLVQKLTFLLRDIARQVNDLTDAVMPTANHSASITGDTLVRTGTAKYRGFCVNVVTAVGTIDIRDGTSAGGGVIIETIPIATAVGTRVNMAVPINCETGIYVDYNGGATGTLVVYYES
jgi:hypothetical protein